MNLPGFRWPVLSHLTREARDTLWLLAMLTLVLLPHLPRLPWWSSLLAGATLGWRAWLAATDKPLPSRWLLYVLMMASIAMTWLSHRTLIGREAGITLVVVLTTLKCMELRARRDALVCLYLGFFLILTQFFYSQGIGTAALMLVVVWGLLTSLVLGQRPTGRPSLKDVGLESFRAMVYGLPLMVVLFVLFPRFGPIWSLPGDAKARTGLSDEVKLGDIGELAQDSRVALRVRFKGPPPPAHQLYFRGPTLDHFDGTDWTPAAQVQGWRPPVRAQRPSVDYQITLEPQALNVLPLLDGTVQAQSTPGTPTTTLRRSGLTWWTPKTQVRLQLDAVAGSGAQEGPWEANPWMHEWLQLPRGFNPATLAWAARFQSQASLRNANASEQVQALLRHIRQENYRYTLNPGKPSTATPHLIDDFWLNQRAGFCEHYASAMVVVLRAIGIPSRMVVGYHGAELNPVDGQWVVRNSHAHAWVEYWQADRGWLRADPTNAVAPERVERPAANATGANLPAGLGRVTPDLIKRWRANWEAVDHRWNVWVLQYSNEQQRSLMKSLGWRSPDTEQLVVLIGSGMATLALVSALWMAARNRPAKVPPWQALEARVDRALSQSGWPRPPGPTPASPSAWRRQLGAQAGTGTTHQRPPDQTRLWQALSTLDRMRYGELSGSTRKAAWRTARSAVREIETICRHNQVQRHS